MMNIWIEFSKQWDGYTNDSECKQKWKKDFKNDRKELSIRTLHYLARKII